MAAPFPSPTSKWHDKTYPSLSPSRPELSAKGKTVLITGGGTGIGAKTAEYFAEAGASRIAILGRRLQPLLETKTTIQQKYPNLEIFAVSADVTNKTQVGSAFSDFLGDSKLDILISGAAIIGPQENVQDADADEFLEAVTTNLKGSLNIAQAFLKYATEDAVVINISSSAAHINFGPGIVSYSVAKLAVFRLWDSVAFANPGFIVFHVQPGVVNTEINREVGGCAAVGFEDHVSLPASFNVWLVSPEARFLKGKFLWANWDVDELKARAKEIEAGEQFNIGMVGWPFSEGSAGFRVPWDSENAALGSS